MYAYPLSVMTTVDESSLGDKKHEHIMKDADKTTHLKIIVVALVLALGVSAFAIVKRYNKQEPMVTSPVQSR